MDPRRSSKLLAYLQLFRAPNVFTAAADVTMGYLFAHGSLGLLGPYPWLLGASCLLYTAGMVLNDVYDFAADSVQRPSRPLPSGRISLAWAKRLGYQMLFVGVLLGCLAGFVRPHAEALAWRSGVLALLTAGCVVLYDAAAKDTCVGPLMMGACRFLNVLLGMSAAPRTGGDLLPWLGYEPPQLLAAAGIGVYIAGVTWFARGEAEEGGRPRLLLGVGVMTAGLALLATFPQWFPHFPVWLSNAPVVWPLLVALLAATVIRRGLIAVVDPNPDRVQRVVKLCLLLLIVLDAEICLLVSDPASAVGVAALLVPALLLGRWVYST